jgi:hypothetical protein
MAAVTMSASEMATLVAEAVRVALATMKKEEQEEVQGAEGGRGKGSGNGRRLLDLKSFSNMRPTTDKKESGPNGALASASL